MRKGSRDTDGNVLSLDTDIVNEQSNESTVEAAKVGLGNKGASVDGSGPSVVTKSSAAPAQSSLDTTTATGRR